MGQGAIVGTKNWIDRLRRSSALETGKLVGGKSTDDRVRHEQHMRLTYCLDFRYDLDFVRYTRTFVNCQAEEPVSCCYSISCSTFDKLKGLL